MGYLIIDRIEGRLAVCEAEDKRKLNICLDQIDGGPKEGDLLTESGGRYRVDRESTASRRAEMKKKLGDLFR